MAKNRTSERTKMKLIHFAAACFFALVTGMFFSDAVLCDNINSEGGEIIERYRKIISRHDAFFYEFQAELSSRIDHSTDRERLQIAGHLKKYKDDIHFFFSASAPNSDITSDRELIKNSEVWLSLQKTNTKNSNNNMDQPVCIACNNLNSSNIKDVTSQCLGRFGGFFVPFGYIALEIMGDEMFCLPDILDQIQYDGTENHLAKYTGIYNGFLWTVMISMENNMPVSIEAEREQNKIGMTDWIKFDISYGQMDGEIFPRRADISFRINGKTHEDQRGNTVTTAPSENSYIAQYSFKKYKDGSESDFELSKLNTAIPNGTLIYMINDRQIEYIWMDGKIVPKTDELMLAVARGNHRFFPGPKEPRFWLMLVGILAVLAAGGWKLSPFWKSDRKPVAPKSTGNGG